MLMGEVMMGLGGNGRSDSGGDGGVGDNCDRGDSGCGGDGCSEW